jgi:hypothetical protein
LSEESFIGYLNEPDIHDATVQQVIQGDRQISVVVKTSKGLLFRFEFSDVRSVKMNHPEGMVLYSLSEMKEPSPYRRFVFTNWDEQDDASLEVVAREMTSAEQ